MDTGALRPYGTFAHDPPPRRDDVAASPVATDLPTQKTVRPTQAASDGGATGDRAPRQDHPAVLTGFERDLQSGSIVYRWVDQTTRKVILEIPRSDKIRSQQSYSGRETTDATHLVDRSI